MYRVIRSGEIEPSPGGTITFEGEPFGSGVSFYLGERVPGAGPDLHRHPYSETWIVRGGRGRFTADGDDVEAGGRGTSSWSARTRRTCSRASAPTGWT